MKKIFCLTLAVWMLLSLAACKGTESNPSTHSGSSASEGNETTPPSPAEVEAAIAAALGDGYQATVDVPEDEMFNCALGQADLEKIDSYVAKQALISAVDLDSVVVAKCKEEAYAEELVKIFNEKFEMVSSYAAQYSFALSKVQGTRICRVGDTVLYILAGASPDQNATQEEAARLAAAEYEKIDGALKELYGFVPENLAALSR